MNLAMLLMVAAHESAAPPAGIPGEPTDVEIYVYSGVKYGVQWVNSTDLPGTCQTEIDVDGDGVAEHVEPITRTSKDLGTTTFPSECQVRHTNVNGASDWVPASGAV